MGMCRLKFRGLSRKRAGAIIAIIFLALNDLAVMAADGTDGGNGTGGIDKANTMVRGYFGNGVNLMYAIGALTGLIGAIKVYQKWNGGDQDTSKVAAAWFGSCIFLVVVATIIRSFFSIA